MKSPIGSFIIAEIMLGTVALLSDYWITCLNRLLNNSNTSNLLWRVFLDEIVHCSIAILSWICILHFLNYKKLLSPIWTPVSTINKSYYDVLLLFRDYILAASVSLLLDTDHFISLDPFYIRSVHEATHLHNRSFGHSLQFLILLIIFMTVIVIATRLLYQYYYNDNYSININTNDDTTTSNIANGDNNSNINIISTSSNRNNHSKSTYNNYTSILVCIKYISIVTNSIIMHQCRDAIRHGIYIGYLYNNSIFYNIILSWIPYYSWLDIHINNGYITTAPLGQSLLYLIIVLLIPYIITNSISICIYLIHIKYKNTNNTSICCQSKNIQSIETAVLSMKSIQDIV